MCFAHAGADKALYPPFRQGRETAMQPAQMEKDFDAGTVLVSGQ